MAEVDDSWQRKREALYCGIGRFFVSFSRLVGYMTSGVISMTGAGHGDAVFKAWQLGLTGVEADRIRLLYFGVASTTLELTPEDLRIRDALSNEIQVSIIPTRNKFAHGSWHVADGLYLDNIAYLEYEKLHHKTAYRQGDEQYTAADLQALCDRVDELCDLLYHFSSGCVIRMHRRQQRVCDHLELVDGRVRVQQRPSG